MDLPLGPGELIAGKYRVERQLGDGGMGVVVAAVHVKLAERRAIKIMRPEIAVSAESTRRFLREAQAAARLKSEHVARVYDVDELDGGVPYMVMEYLDGADLAAVLATAGALPVSEATLYIRQACEALAEAHAAGLVHRDIKPSNLFLTRRADGSPTIKVLDFGIAKAVMSDESAKKSALTARGLLLGTAHYMSPEQMEGAADIDARTDIWSLGVTLYELISGKLPFDADTFMKLYGLITEVDPRPLAEVLPDRPPELEALIHRCLAKHRDERPASAMELAEALRPFSPGKVTDASPARDLAAAQARARAPTEIAPAIDAKAATSLDVDVDTHARRAAPLAPTSGELDRAPLAQPPVAPRRVPIAAAVVFTVSAAVALVVARSGLSPSPSSSAEPLPAVASPLPARGDVAPPLDAGPSASAPLVEPAASAPLAGSAVPSSASVKPAPRPRASAIAPRASAAPSVAPRPAAPSRTEVVIP